MIILQKENTNPISVENNSELYYLGIDGGGTKTVFKLIDCNNKEIRTIVKGPSNPNDIGIDKCLDLLKSGIYEICMKIPVSSVIMFAGLSGCGNYPHFFDFFNNFGFYSFNYGTDIENLAGKINDKKYVLVIMGTGFVTYAVNDEIKYRIGGWGQYFDNGGSGFNLGRDAITASLSDIDGSGGATLITKLIEDMIGEKVEEHLSVFYRKGKKYIAEFAETVFLAAEQNDNIAIYILKKNCSYVAEKINTALNHLNASSEEKIPIYFSGGLINRKDILFPLINDNITAGECIFIPVDFEPVDGALKCAMKLNDKKNKGISLC